MDLRRLNPAKQALSLFDEFKDFAFKGNVIDLAIGVIIGGAFGNLVNSLCVTSSCRLSASSCRARRVTWDGWL